MSDPSGWLVKSKHGFVRAMWHGKPSEEMLEIARHDGDEVIPLYTAEGLQQAQQDARRMDWMQAHCTGHLTERGFVLGIFEGPTIRDAVDRAMAAEASTAPVRNGGTHEQG